MFDSTPLSVPQKIGVVLGGFLVGAATAFVTSIVGCLLGIAVDWFALHTQLIHLAEYQSWLPVIGLFYGFYIGVVAGLIVWWRFCAKRFR
jgi:hypothetical protein